MILQPFLESEIVYSQNALRMIQAFDPAEFNQEHFEAWWMTQKNTVGDKILLEYLVQYPSSPNPRPDGC